MGWCTTFDLDRFAAAAEGYLRSRAAENTLLLSAAQAARYGWRNPVSGQQPGVPGPELLLGWWEPPDGGEPRGAFVHDPAAPLLISGKAPEMGAALAATLARMGRQVFGVDAPTEVADAFAAAWSQRAGTTVRAHRNCRVYRLAGVPQGVELPGPAGRLRCATAEDRALLADWLTAFAAEAAERIGSASDMADDLISYGGAVFWEVPQRPGRRRDAAHYLPIPQHRDPAQFGEPVHQPMALATLTRPVAGIVRISMLYTPPERRHSGYATALTLAASRAVLSGTGPDAASGRVSEVVMITDKNRPDRWGARFGYQLVGERAVLRFGPVTGPIPRARPTGAMPRLPTGPLPRLPRQRR
ncbi:MAG: hypothetical protein QOG28_2435 [Trebonia sp.]|nr:hypothetical protein [Trebonia sp.]